VTDDPYSAGQDSADPAVLDPDTAFEQANQREQEIARRLNDRRLREEVEQRFRREQLADLKRPRVFSLDQFLARPATDPTYRIGDVWPTGGRVVLSAQFKAGKSTVVGNVIRALADGTPLFDRFAVRPGARVLLIDDELDDRTLQRWLTDQRIENTTQVAVTCLRGALSSFAITDPDIRAAWARDIAGADVVILDCLRPILDALGLDENHDAGKFLVAFDALLAEAGATEALVLHHMGHNAERSRGDSRINDWPDALWKLVRDKSDEDPTTDDVAGSRYFSAFGRDVNFPQTELSYHPATRHLVLGEQALNRQQTVTKRRTEMARTAVIAVVNAQPGILKTALRKACAEEHGIGRHEDVDAAVAYLIGTEEITLKKAGNAHQHYPGTPLHSDQQLPDMPDVPNVPQHQPGTRADMCPPAYIGGHITTTASSTRCPHGMPNGHKPDPFVGGRLACPQCAIDHANNQETS
jgi:hypothetical protein